MRRRRSSREVIHISTNFILIRHGETDWNKSDRFRGRSEISLNETGREQARLIAQRLAGVKLAGIYSSPLPRALETAAPLAADHEITVEPHADLLDIDYGAWEGLSQEEAADKYPDICDAWTRRPGHVRFPGGESTRQVRVRVENLLKELSEEHLGETVALVSHRITCLVTICYVLGLPNDALWRVQQDVACIDEFRERESNSYVLTCLNDTSHLR